MKTVCYLAYGSNLHPVRLRKRTPSARLMGTTALPGYELSFSKRSNLDQSGKCTIARNGNTQVHAALYAIDGEEMALLDHAEGLGNGYTRKAIQARFAGERHTCMTYVAAPSHLDPDLKPIDWYRELVAEGARYLGFPDDYVQMISHLEVAGDKNEKRRRQNEALVSEIRAHSARHPYFPTSQI